MGDQFYRSTYRRTPFAMTGFAAVLVAIVGGTTAAIWFAPNGDTLLPIMLWLLGLAMAAIVVILVVSYRIHCWTIEPEGLRIEERPVVSFAGLRRRVSIPFGDIAAIRRVESGLDLLIEIAATDGARYRIGQIVAKPGVTPLSLSDFAEDLRAAHAASGAPSADTGEGLSFWNRALGLLLLGILFVIAFGFAAAAALALFGSGIGVRARGGEALGIALALPFGVGWMILRSLRRRRSVMAHR